MARKEIAPAVQDRTRDRIVRYANQHHAGKFLRLDVRFRGAFCYIDAYEDAEDLANGSPTHLCRLRYLGHADLWGFDFYTLRSRQIRAEFSGDR